MAGAPISVVRLEAGWLDWAAGNRLAAAFVSSASDRDATTVGAISRLNFFESNGDG